MSNGNSCNGVDGLQSQDWGTCVHTENEDKPWWQIDFGAIYSIEFVNISVRADHPVNEHYSKSVFYNYFYISCMNLNVRNMKMKRYKSFLSTILK